jgi:hypothetical protein
MQAVGINEFSLPLYLLLGGTWIGVGVGIGLGDNAFGSFIDSWLDLDGPLEILLFLSWNAAWIWDGCRSDGQDDQGREFTADGEDQGEGDEFVQVVTGTEGELVVSSGYRRRC